MEIIVENFYGNIRPKGLIGKMESIRKLSNFSFHWKTISYQNNLKHTAFFFTFFQGLKM